jgi:hypothetical protein
MFSPPVGHQSGASAVCAYRAQRGRNIRNHFDREVVRVTAATERRVSGRFTSTGSGTCNVVRTPIPRPCARGASRSSPPSARSRRTHFLMKRLPHVAAEMAPARSRLQLTGVMNLAGRAALVAAIRAGQGPKPPCLPRWLEALRGSLSLIEPTMNTACYPPICRPGARA